ncbi:MAG: bifunctional hydroxymethylpyrimidine kinase/phosphomethylpyrimidine kinase [Verrucomicrobia bacterium]|nr:bifunctional hydroxymethylpyrimidine kinase/phosphomethylpyrimidine kinase [Verrucomicrobiota bacterium]
MTRRPDLAVALTIAGSDSGGGAGIQADLKTFAALGVHGTSAITGVTAQNPRRVQGIQACRPTLVRAQLEAVFEELRPAAVKTGMLHSEATVRAVADFLKHARPRLPLIVDPVLWATSGARLLTVAAIRRLESALLLEAALVTPNVSEAEVLSGCRLRSVEDLRRAARAIHERYGCAALVKGGHLPATAEAVDLFYDGRTELLLSAARVRGVSLHGTGCTYSAAITAYCARGCSLPRAVGLAKEYVTQAIAHHGRVGGHDVLNHFPPIRGARSGGTPEGNARRYAKPRF